MKSKILYLFLLVLCISACRDDINEFTVETSDEEPPLVFVETTIMGRVVDESGGPVANALVRLGSASVFSGTDGNFEFKQKNVQKSTGTISADVPGFFTGISEASLAIDSESFIEIQVLSKGEAHMVSSTTDAAIVKPNGVEISIPANSLVDRSGNAFDGNAMVFSKWMNPTDEDLGGMMPGALVATTQNEEDVVLATFGMIALDFESESGETLSLAEGSVVEVQLPIPEELVSDAPDEMPLWEFNVEEGRWFENGIALRNGKNYTFSASGGGFWNCDIPLESVCLTMQILNEDLTVAPFVKVVIEDLTNNFIYWGYSDLRGFVICANVPRAAPLKLSIVDHCDNIVYMEEIGVFDDDTNLEDIILEENLGTFIIDVQGTLTNCVQTDVPQGHLGVRYPGRLQIYPFTEGSYDAGVAFICTEFPEIDFTVYSNSEPKATETVSVFTFDDVDLGALTSCEDLDDVFTFEVDGLNLFASPTQFYLRPNQTTDLLVLEGMSGAGNITIELRDYQGIGIYNENAFCTLQGGALEPQFEELDGASPSIQVEVTDDDGDFISGNFSGTLENDLEEDKTISGTFKVRKAP